MSELIISNKEDLTDIADAVRYQTGETDLLSLGDMANKIRNLSAGGGISVQADWQQNDETAANYIKNRTHWIEETFVETFPETNYNGSLDIYDEDIFSKLSPNAVCTVTINGVAYTTTARHGIYNAYEWYVLGNGELVGEDDEDTGLPFGLFIDIYDENYAETDIDVYTFKIESVVTVINKIPDIYLPAKIGTEGTGGFSEIFNDLTGNEAVGDYSHAENFNTSAIGYAAHAEGLQSTAKGYSSHAEGCQTQANGVYSHAEGYYSTTSGANSHASGEGTIAKGRNQYVSGSYNIEDNSSLVIVGNGESSSSRSNAYRLDGSGNGYFSGDVYAKNKKLATEEYVNIRVPAWTSADEGKTLKIINGTPTWA